MKALQRHARDKHALKRKVPTCTYCDRHFNRRAQATRHITHHHLGQAKIVMKTPKITPIKVIPFLPPFENTTKKIRARMIQGQNPYQNPYSVNKPKTKENTPESTTTNNTTPTLTESHDTQDLEVHNMGKQDEPRIITTETKTYEQLLSEISGLKATIQGVATVAKVSEAAIVNMVTEGRTNDNTHKLKNYINRHRAEIREQNWIEIHKGALQYPEYFTAEFSKDIKTLFSKCIV